MTRVELFTQVIQKAERESYEKWLGSLSDEDWWNEIREEVIKPIFRDAVTALTQAKYFAETFAINGTGKGILLQAGNPCVKVELRLIGDAIQMTSSTDSITNARWEGRERVAEESISLVNEVIVHIARKTIPLS